MNFFKKNIWWLFIYIVSSQSIWSLRIGFLPVQMSQHTSQQLQKDFSFTKTASTDLSMQLANLYQTIVQVSKQKPFSMVLPAYIYANIKHQKISPTAIERQDLQTIAQQTDSDALLFSQLSIAHKENKIKYKLVTSLYYSVNNIQTDYISVECSRPLDCFYTALKKRFSQISINSKNIGKQDGNWIFLLDATAANQREILALAQSLKQYSIATASVCSLFPSGEISQAHFTNKNHLIRYLQNLKTQGGQSLEHNFANLIACGLRQSNRMGKTASILFLTGSKPRDATQTQGLLRQLASQNQLTILTSGALHFDGINFWQALSQQLQYSHKTRQQDLVYRQKVGLADGREFYIFKKGSHLIESNDAILDPQDFFTEVPAHQLDNFSASRLLSMYKEMSQQRLASHSAIEIILPSFHKTLANQSSQKQTKRVLVQIEHKPFWFSVPAQANLIEQEWYYFLVHLKEPADGIPLHNDNAKVFSNKSEISSLLLLPLDLYLKNPQNFFGKSLQRSSWYYVFGQVKAIRNH